MFIPFHYGYWDDPGRTRAANELTLYEWGPVSKQPSYKFAAVRLERVDAPGTSQPGEGGGIASASDLVERARHIAKAAVKLVMPARQHVRDYLGLLEAGERAFADAME